MKIYQVLCFTFLLNHQLHGEELKFITGKELYELCESYFSLLDEKKGLERKVIADAAGCMRYIAGVVDALSFLVENGEANQQYCYDGTPTNQGELMLYVIGVFREHPEFIEYSGPTVVMTVLKSFFPCE